MLMTTRLLVCIVFGGLLAAGMKVAPPARAMSLQEVVSTIRDSGGYYARAGASLKGADCSGLVSVAQTLAMGLPIHRLGSTRTVLAGQWPNAIPGAAPDDVFIIAANVSHMVAQINGVGIESSTYGQPFKVGPEAASVWEPRFQRWHVDPAVLTL